MLLFLLMVMILKIAEAMAEISPTSLQQTGLSANVANKRHRMDKSALNGLRMKVSALHYPPSFMITQEPGGNVSYSGFCINILNWMTEHFNMSFSYVELRESQIKKYGQLMAAINQLRDDEIDMLAFTVGPSLERAKIMDLSTLVTMQKFILLLPYPEEKSKMFSFINPFQSEVWLLLVISTAVLVVLMGVIGSTRWDVPNSNHRPTFLANINESIMYAFKILTGQGTQTIHPSRDSFCILTGLWCLMMVIVTNCYSRSLFSMAMIPQLNPVPNTLEELSKISGFKLALLDKSIFAESILSGTYGVNKILGDFLRQNPRYLTHTYQEELDYVLKEKCTVISTEFTNMFRLAVDLKETGKCRMTLSRSLNYFQTFSFGLKKGSPYNDIINKNLQYLWENGLMSYWLASYARNIEQCRIKKGGTPITRILKLDDIQSALLLLGIGLGFSGLVFCVELVTFRYSNIRPKSFVGKV